MASEGTSAPNIPNKTRFVDIQNREEKARERLRQRLEQINRRVENGRVLSEPDIEELKRLKALAALKPGRGIYIDPLFVALRHALRSNDGNLTPVTVEHSNGQIGFTPALDNPDHDRQVVRSALLYGILCSRKVATPPVLSVGTDNEPETGPDTNHPNMAKFLAGFYSALGKIAGQMDLAQRTLLITINDVRVNSRQTPNIFTKQFADVVSDLIDRNISADNPKLKPFVDELLDRSTDLGPDDQSDIPLHEMAIDLPDLNSWIDDNVVADNIYLMGPMIFASMFEELKAFQVVDKLVEMSQQGYITLTRGTAGTQLYNYWRNAPNRMSEVERQTFYAMTLGLPSGQPGASSNTDFQDLWLRFVSSVSSLVRENRVDQLLRSELPSAINQQQVKKAARDLVTNMSLHGYGMAFYAAVDLQEQINEMIKLLSDPEVRSAFGARDMWGVIDQIAQVELGGARNSSKYRTLATSGAICVRWLGDNLDRLRDPTMPIIELKDVSNPPARMAGQTATSHPTDYDLINACELWLADSALDDIRIEQMSQPRESPQQPSRPIQMPSIARDLLEGAGLGVSFDHQPQMANGHDRSGYAAY